MTICIWHSQLHLLNSSPQLEYRPCMYYDAKLLLLKDIQFDLLSQDMNLNWLFSTQNLFILFLAKPISFFFVSSTMTTPSPPPPSNGHEGGSKPTRTTDDSSSTIRLTLQVDNTSALPIFLQGRVSNEEMEVTKKKKQKT